MKGDQRILSQSRIPDILQTATLSKTEIDSRVHNAAGSCASRCQFVEISSPIYTSTKADTKPLIWTETIQKTFETLKTTLTSAPV